MLIKPTIIIMDNDILTHFFLPIFNPLFQSPLDHLF